jgi:hypothetical protein
MITFLFFSEEKRRFRAGADEVKRYSKQPARQLVAEIKELFMNFIEKINQKG